MPSHRSSRTVILHLSDIHLNIKNISNMPTYLIADKIIRGLKSFKIFKVDFICLTGDITSHGIKTEFEEVKKFLDLIKDELRVNKERILIVPGNHDFLWKRREVDKPPRSSNFITRIDPTNFLSFYREYFGEEYDLNIVQKEFSEENLFFLLLNSNKHGRIKPADRMDGFPISTVKNFDTSKLLELRRNLSTSSSDSTKITLLHHGFMERTEKVLSVTSDLYDTLVELNFDLILHGHFHESRTYYSRDSGIKIITHGNGTLGALSEDRPESIPRQISILEIIHPKRLMRVVSLKLNKVKGVFQLDYRWGSHYFSYKKQIPISTDQSIYPAGMDYEFIFIIDCFSVVIENFDKNENKLNKMISILFMEMGLIKLINLCGGDHTSILSETEQVLHTELINQASAIRRGLFDYESLYSRDKIIGLIQIAGRISKETLDLNLFTFLNFKWISWFKLQQFIE